MDFIKNALREFRHVVWPTREETKKYFVVVLAVLVSFGIYLFAFGNIFSEILFGLKNAVNPSNTNTSAEVKLPEGLENLSITTEDGSSVEATIVDEETTDAATEENTIEIPVEEIIAEEPTVETEVQ